MYDVPAYMASLIAALKQCFSVRLLYVGLQGSYLRGEATENSDLDIVVILESLTAEDLAAYREVINRLPYPEKSCGFICGRQEMASWNPLEICGMRHGTKDYFGTLSDYLPPYTRRDVENFIMLSVGNLYHELCHRYIHAEAEKNKRKLPGTYKGVFFILQHLYYLKDGKFYLTKMEMAEHLSPVDREVMEMGEKLKCLPDYDFQEAFRLLLSWCQKVFNEPLC